MLCEVSGIAKGLSTLVIKHDQILRWRGQTLHEKVIMFHADDNGLGSSQICIITIKVDMNNPRLDVVTLSHGEGLKFVDEWVDQGG
jgi:hypothetical protein